MININRSDLVFTRNNGTKYTQIRPFSSYTYDWESNNSAYTLFGATFEDPDANKIFFTVEDIEKLLNKQEIVINN